MIRRLPARVDALLVEDAAPHALAAFRIVFALALLLDTAQTLYFRQLLFDPVPFLRPAAVPFGILLPCWLAVELLLLIGFLTRVAAVANYALAVFVLGFVAKDAGVDWHVDSLSLTGSLFLLFAPCARVWSLDAALGRKAARPVARIHGVLIVTAIAVLYLDSALWKLTSPMYMSGLGFWAPASLPFNSLGVSWLLESEVASRAIGYFVLGFELAFLLVVRATRPRLAVLAAAAVFHVGIAVYLPIPIFTLMMLAFLIGAIPGEILERWAARLALSGRNAAPRIVAARARSWATIVAVVLLFVWIPSAVVLAGRGPLLRAFSGEGPAMAAFDRPAGRYAAAIYPWTGWTDHAVFMDRHFEGYTVQTMLAFRSEDGDEPLPIVRGDGRPGWYDTNRVYVLWTFRAVRPGLPLVAMEHALTRFTLFWARRSGIDLESGEVAVRQRPVRVSLDHWIPGLLARNLATPWRDAGRLLGTPTNLRVEWTPAGRRAS